jgi:hypothetical protein
VPGQLFVGGVIVVDRQPDLLEVVAAAHPPRGFASSLDGGQQQPDQHTDDRNHDQQFDQRKTGSARRRIMTHGITRAVATRNEKTRHKKGSDREVKE